MDYYTNFKGETINIKELDDIKLVSLYKFLLGYCRVLKKIAISNGIKGLWYSILFGINDNRKYLKYMRNMNHLKNRLQKEIKVRKLKIGEMSSTLM